MPVTRVVVTRLNDDGEAEVAAEVTVPRNTGKTPVVIPESVYYIGRFEGGDKEARELAVLQAKRQAERF